MNLIQVFIDNNNNNNKFEELTYYYCIYEQISKYLNSKKLIRMKQNI